MTLRILDHPSESRIELHFRNETDQFLCLSADAWPNQAGKLNQASRNAFLVVGEHRFPVEEFNTGYCIGEEECTIRLSPGDEISGSISYVDFSLPRDLWSAPKRFEYSRTAWICGAR